MDSETLRGSRLGGHSLERDPGVDYSERKIVRYECLACHALTSLPFAIDAEEPPSWECARCGEKAFREGEVDTLAAEVKPIKESKTHFEMLLERRTREELEEILNERLAYLRERRGAGLEDLAG